MLVLKRKKDESFSIYTPDNVEIFVKICNIDGAKRVSVGIEAPGDYKILRSELPKDESTQS